jgi:hypothetical protein
MLHELDLEELKVVAEQIGKTNKVWNKYAAILKQCDYYRELGLEPIVYSDITGTQIVFSSREFQQGKFH